MSNASTVVVKPLVWTKTGDGFEAQTRIGWYRLYVPRPIDDQGKIILVYSGSGIAPRLFDDLDDAMRKAESFHNVRVRGCLDWKETDA